MSKPLSSPTSKLSRPKADAADRFLKLMLSGDVEGIGRACDGFDRVVELGGDEVEGEGDWREEGDDSDEKGGGEQEDEEKGRDR